MDPQHHGILLFAHGARDPNWAAPFQAVAEKVRQHRPDTQVLLAFLEFMSPTMSEAASCLVAGGCRRIDVLPLFLGAGGHVRKDVPVLLDDLRQAHPEVEFHLRPAIGEHPAVVAAMAAAACELPTP